MQFQANIDDESERDLDRFLLSVLFVIIGGSSQFRDNCG